MSSSKPPGKRLKAKISRRSPDSGEPAEPLRASGAETTLTTNLTRGRATPSPSQTSVASNNATPDSESGEHRALWAIALRKLPEKEREGLLVTDHTAQNNVLEQLITDVRQQQQEFEANATQFNFGGRQFVPRIYADRALALLDKCKEVGDVAVSYDPVHAALPWAGVRLLLQVALSEKNQRREILNGIEKILSISGRYQILEMLYLPERNLDQSQMRLQTALVDTYTLVLKFLLKAKHIQAQGSVARGSRALFHTDELSGFLNEAEQHESRIDRAAQLCESLAAHESRGRFGKTEERVQHLQNLLEDFKTLLESIQSGVSSIYKHIEQSKRSDILRWISSIPFEDDHYTARKDRAVDSCRWLLEDERFQAWWRSESGLIMWLHGLPGTGKTKLVSSVVDFAQSARDDDSRTYRDVELTESRTDSAVAYFYCDRNREDHRDPRSILCSFVRQLSTSNDDNSLHSHSVATYDKNKASGFATNQLSYEQALGHLQVLAQAPSQTLLILDALDECEESTRTKLLQDLQALLPKGDRPIRIFISSRPNLDIKAELHEGLNRAIAATDNRDDIRRYVDDTITKPDAPDFWRRKISSDLRQHVFETLTKKAEGNFQWVTLQIKQLHTLKRTSDVKSRLGELPKTLKESYDEIYGEIRNTEGSESVVAERAFKWLMGSNRPLGQDLLVEAVRQDPSADAIDDVADIDIDFVLCACRNLIFLDSSGKVCRFSHLSVQEYLEDHRFQHAEANELVATICLKRLNCLTTLDPGHLRWLYAYTAWNWLFHVKKCFEDLPGNPGVLSLLQHFLGSRDGTSSNYRLWLQAECRLRLHPETDEDGTIAGVYFPDEDVYPDLLSPTNHVLLPLALFGLHRILPDLWQPNKFECNDFEDDLLGLAVQGGQVSLVKELIDAEFNVNRIGTGRNARTALYIATGAKRIQIARMLLAAGAEVNFCAPGEYDEKGQYYGNALQLAARQTYKSMVDLLLEAGAKVNAVGGRYGTALQAAFLNIVGVSKLLDAGADVNVQGGEYGNALQAASTHPGNKAIVEMLLNAGADVNALGGPYGNALQAASSKSDSAVVKILLTAGADVNAQSGPYGNALQAASTRPRKKAIVEMLLNAGADVNAVGGHYGNALQAASIQPGNEAIVEILLNAGADVNAVASIQPGYEAIVEILLNAGADVNAVGGHYGNALQAASIQPGNEAIVEILLNAGADVNAVGGHYGNALKAAIANGRTKVSKILLAAGADVKAHGGPYGDALDLAVLNKSNDTVQLLLDAGADIEHSGQCGKTLSAGFVAGAFDIVQSFLATGADSSTLEVDIGRWIKLGPALYDDYLAPKAGKRIFESAPRAIQQMLESTDQWLEDDENRDCPPLIVGHEEGGRPMKVYMERGRVHLENIKRRMIEAGEWDG